MATKQEVLAQITRLRAQLDALTAQIADTPVLVNTIPDGIKPWRAGTMTAPTTYTANTDVRVYGGIPYRCAQTHTHHGEAGWEPGVAPALWVQYHGTSPESARPFVPPTGAHDIYKAGEYAVFDGGVIKRAKMDTAYSPTEYGQAWEDVPA